MMHIAWCCLEDVSYCFARSFLKFQDHMALKIVKFDLDWAFPDCNSSLNTPMATKWCTKLEVALKRCLIVFLRSSVKLQGHTAKKNQRFWPKLRVSWLQFKNRWFWPKLGVSGLYLQFEITNGYEMMHKAWSSIEEVPYCLSRSYVKFQDHMALKIIKFDPIWAFPDCNSSLNQPMATKWCTNVEVE